MTTSHSPRANRRAVHYDSSFTIAACEITPTKCANRLILKEQKVILRSSNQGVKIVMPLLDLLVYHSANSSASTQTATTLPLLLGSSNICRRSMLSSLLSLISGGCA